MHSVFNWCYLDQNGKPPEALKSVFSKDKEYHFWNRKGKGLVILLLKQSKFMTVVFERLHFLIQENKNSLTKHVIIILYSMMHGAEQIEKSCLLVCFLFVCFLVGILPGSKIAL